MTEKTIRGLIPKEILDKWDGYRVNLFPPQSLDSSPDTLIYLINKDRTVFKLWMKIDKIVFYEESKLGPTKGNGEDE